jgi:hypothetical protein
MVSGSPGGIKEFQELLKAPEGIKEFQELLKAPESS